MLSDCARQLYERKEIVQNSVKLNGINFYQRDKESLQRYPQQYGVRGGIGLGSGEGKLEEVKSARSNSSMMLDEQQPDEGRIRHSVQKGLWFPILNNLTNLIMEKRKEIQEKAFAVLFKIFNEYRQDFYLEFWREILNQIILPLLEDIHLAVEIPNKK